MLQTKFVQGINLTDLNERLNQALSEITSKEPSIKYFLEDNLAIIEYQTNEAYQNRLCSECAHWEDTGNGTLVNFCTQEGGMGKEILIAILGGLFGSFVGMVLMSLLGIW